MLFGHSCVSENLIKIVITHWFNYLILPILKGGGKDLETAATFAQNQSTTTTASVAVPKSVGISSPFLTQPIKIEIPSSLPATSKTALPIKLTTGSMQMQVAQPMKFPKVNTANNRVPPGSSSKPGELKLSLRYLIHLLIVNFHIYHCC